MKAVLQEIEETTEASLVEQIKVVDNGMQSLQQKIGAIHQEETDLIDALTYAREKEAAATAAFTESPTDENQKKLETAREFTAQSQKKVSLYQNGSGVHNQDLSELRQRRKTLLAELVSLRRLGAKDSLQVEYAKLTRELPDEFIRIMAIQSQLDGTPPMMLDPKKIIERVIPDWRHKLQLECEKIVAELEAV